MTVMLQGPNGILSGVANTVPNNKADKSAETQEVRGYEGGKEAENKARENKFRVVTKRSMY